MPGVARQPAASPPSAHHTGRRAALEDLRSFAARSAVGTALPSTRVVQQRYRVSALTAQRVLAELVREGLVEVRPGRGSYVAARRPASAVDVTWQTAVLGSRDGPAWANLELLRAVPDDVADLRQPYLEASLQPTGLLAAAAARSARRPGTWDRADFDGEHELRALFASAAGHHFTAQDVIVTAGGQPALAMCFRAVGRPGDVVLFEQITYPGALTAARSAGLVPRPVPADADGVLPDELDRALARTGATLVYLQPRHSVPTGAVLAPDRREAVLETLRRHRAFCIEDDYASSLDLTGTSPSPLASQDDAGHVIYIQSLTKPVAPGLRIAGIVCAGSVVARLRSVQVAESTFLSGLPQRTAVDVLTSPSWPRHRRGLVRELAARRDAMIDTLVAGTPRAGSIRRPRGGLGLWWPLPRTVDEQQVRDAAAAARIAVNRGALYCLGGTSGPALRLTFAGASVPVLQDACRRLAAAVDDLADGAH